MDLGQILGWVTCSLSLISVWMTKNKWKGGFVLGACTQIIWIWLGYVRNITAFYPMAVAFFLMYIWSFWTWHKRPWKELNTENLLTRIQYALDKYYRHQHGADGCSDWVNPIDNQALKELRYVRAELQHYSLGKCVHEKYGGGYCIYTDKIC